MTMTMRVKAALNRSPLDDERPAAAAAVEVTRRYGGDRRASRSVHGRDGPVRLWQVALDAHRAETA
jgi:hypothetical protein